MNDLVNRISIGRPIIRAQVTLHPLYVHQEHVDVLSAVRAGVGLSELSAPTVPTVLVVNPSDRPALVAGGTVLHGGMQTRMVSHSVLLPAREPARLPVVCVERGRWDGDARFELTGSVAPRRVRRTSEETLARGTARQRTADQSAVWDTVEQELRGDQRSNPTRNLTHRQEVTTGDRRATIIRELATGGPLPEQAGVLVSHGERMVGLDLFGSPELLADHWAGLVQSYYANGPERIHGRASTTVGLAFIRYFLTRRTEATDGVGLGQEHRVVTRSLTGSALVASDRLVHASCFALAA